VSLVFTALHEMQTRSSDENSVRPSVRLSVCLSVCLSNAYIVTQRKKELRDTIEERIKGNTHRERKRLHMLSDPHHQQSIWNWKRTTTSERVYTSQSRGVSRVGKN